ncbi:hypothetical protein L7F22_034248 [Adiantum nelumboides]|nr:hypothetical protein [Adiantum nelumboides]
MDETSPVEKFCESWRNALDDVALAGLDLPENVQAVMLLAALPSSWQPFVSTKTVATLTVPTLISSIMQENILRMSKQNPSSISTTSNLAMFSRSSSSSSRSRSFRPANRFSSSKSSSWRRKSSNSTSKPPFEVKKPYCKGCKIYGHNDRNCWHNRGKKKYNQAHCASGSHTETESEAESCESCNTQYSTEDAHFCCTADTFSEPLPYNVPETSWLLDSGATCNLSSNKDQLHNYKSLRRPFPVRFGNNSTRLALGVGTAHILLSDGNIVAIHDVYYVPHIVKNLISVSQIAKCGTRVEFREGYATIKHQLPNGERYRVLGTQIGKLYLLGCSSPSAECHHVPAPRNSDYTTLLWHYRLGHLNRVSMRITASKNLAKHYDLPAKSKLSLCEGCLFGKLSQQKFSTSSTATHKPLQIVHSDLCGPLPVPSLTHNHYFITFIDDFTRFTMVAFIKDKTSATVLHQFKTYQKLVENHLELSIKILQSDNGGEYTSHIFQEYCHQHGVRHHLTVPNTPQQNGLAERKNRSLMNSARSMLRVAGLPPSFWEEAVSTACYLQNRSYSRTIRGIPYSRWYGKEPDYSFFRIFGCTCYAFIPIPSRHKLDDRAVKAIFVGYGEPHGVKGYRVYDPAKKNFFFSRSLVFDESSLISTPEGNVEASSDDHQLAGLSPMMEAKVIEPTPPTEAMPSNAVTWVAPYDPGAVVPHVPHPLPAPQAPAQLAVPLTAPVSQPATPAANRLSSSRRTIRSRHLRRSFTHLDYANNSNSTRVPPRWDITGPRSSRTRHLQKSPPSSPVTSAGTRSPLSSSNLRGAISEDLHIPSNVAHPNASTSFAARSPIIDVTIDIPSTAASTSPPLHAKTRSLTDLYNTTTQLEPAPANDESFAGSAMSSVVDTSEDGDPVSVEAALSGPCADLWRQAMESELSSLQSNNTWSLVPLPHGRQPISSKWVLRRKLHPDGSVARYKARLVARGFSQIPGLDYTDTFSPVLRMSSLRLLLALAASFDLELYHLDVQTAFLHGELPEELYMQQPSYYESSAHPRYVCRLHRSIYGLKQSPRLWFQRFNDFMITHGYTRLRSEPNVYICHNSFSFLAVALYVDDIPVLGSSKSVVSHAVAELKAAFPITDLGDLTYFLGLQIVRDRSVGTLLVYQSSNVDNLLKEFGLS